MPDRYSNLDFIYETWTADELRKALGNLIDQDEADVVNKHTPTVSMEFGYTAKLWTQFNESLGLRPGYRVLTGGDSARSQQYAARRNSPNSTD